MQTFWKELWDKIKAWFAEKGGVAHVIAGVWAFLVAAFAMNTQFHDFVVNIQKSIPAKIMDLITLGFSLWAFYKTWNKQTSN